MWVTLKLRYRVSLIQNNVSKTVAYANLNRYIEMFLSSLNYKKVYQILKNQFQLSFALRQDHCFLFWVQVSFLTLQFKKFSDWHVLQLCQSGNIIASFLRTL